MTESSRQIAFQALKRIHKGAFADIALDQTLKHSELDQRDRRFVTELVYGIIRRQRTLDTLIDQLSTKKKKRHPVNLQLILRLGFYQLVFLSHIPPSAAVNTTVELAKRNGFRGLAGFVNGILRQYLRLSSGDNHEAADNMDNGHNIYHAESIVNGLQLPSDPVEQLGVLYSYPNWIIEAWLRQLTLEETANLCQWFNRPPSIDVRVNSQRTTLERVEEMLTEVGGPYERVRNMPHALRFTGSPGLIQNLPGFQEGLWCIQDASAQLVSYLLAPQPGEVIIDACAAPGGKTTHIAELMGDRGTIWACDRNASRLRKVSENTKRLGLHSISVQTRDCTLGEPRGITPGNVSKELENEHLPDWHSYADRVLVDAPCSGLGTLHRHADARWRQSRQSVETLSLMQSQLLNQCAQWVKPEGTLVYSTCTLHPLENEAVVIRFLEEHPSWMVDAPTDNPLFESLLSPEGWIKVWPHQQNMDGFFMVRLRRK